MSGEYFDLPASRYTEDEQQIAFYDQLYQRLETLPGVRSVGGVLPMPLTGSGFMLIFQVEGEPIPEPGKEIAANIRVVGANYFATMGIRKVAGRLLDDHDTASAPDVAVVNESAAKKFFGGQAIGQRLTFGDPTSEEARWLEVVGVVGDVHHESLATATDPEIYWSSAQRPIDSTTVVLRAAGAAAALAGPLRQAVAELDPEITLAQVRPLTSLVDDSVAQQRFNGRLLGLFAGLALVGAVACLVLAWRATRVDPMTVLRDE